MITAEAVALPPVNRREVLRYAGIRHGDESWERTLDARLGQCEGCFEGKACWERFPVTVRDGRVELPFAVVDSRALAKNLAGCEELILFAATVGLGIDRLIRRCSAGNMAEAVWLQAIGAERIEALCDSFCARMGRRLEQEGRYLRPRFSPGYGDVPLWLQRDIFRVLVCSRSMGLYLTESCLMVPSKSVTAVMGISDRPCHPGTQGCDYCGKKDCAYRRKG